MTTNAVSIVSAFIEAVNRHVPSEIAALMTDDHTFLDSRGGVSSGRDKMVASWEQYFRMFPDYRIQVESLLADNAVVAVFGRASGTYNGKRGLVPQNRIEMPAAWKAVVEDDRVKLWQVYADWTEGTRIIHEDTLTERQS